MSEHLALRLRFVGLHMAASADCFLFHRNVGVC